MKVYFNGTMKAFAALIASFVREGIAFETKWLGDDVEGQAEIIFTGGY